MDVVEIDMHFALGAIEIYCENLQDTGVAEDRQKLHSKLRDLNTMVWAHDFSDEDELRLILEILRVYQSIEDKCPYAEIMKSVIFFRDFTVRTWNPKPKHIDALLEELKKFGKD
jgi:hypothetical protein